MSSTSIPAVSSRVVFLNAASAAAVSGVERRKLVAELEPAAWEQTANGDKLYPLFRPEAARVYGEHVAAVRAQRSKANTGRVSIRPAELDAAVV